MRSPTWRQDAAERDWGLRPYDDRERLREAAAAVTDVGVDAWLRFSAARTRRRIAEQQFAGVALGSGSTPPAGWIGLDRYRSGTRVFRADLRAGLPLHTGSVPAVLAEHVLEHLLLDELPLVLSEIRRVLVPGGAVRIVSPDARFLARILLDDDLDDPDVREALRRDADMHRWPAGTALQGTVANRLSHQWGQHRSLLTAGLVEELLTAAGFVDVVTPAGVADSVLFDPIPDVHPAAFPDDPEPMNFVVEARRP